MTNRPKKQLSRRDALKIITTVGSVFLMSAPDKWAKPIVQFGALPAHAQTSVRLALLCPSNPPIADLTNVARFTPTSTIQVSPVAANVSLSFSVTFTGGLLFTPPTGTVMTNANGIASLPLEFVPSAENGDIRVNWQFTNTAVGSGACQVVIAWFLNTF